MPRERYFRCRVERKIESRVRQFNPSRFDLVGEERQHGSETKHVGSRERGGHADDLLDSHHGKDTPAIRTLEAKVLVRRGCAARQKRSSVSAGRADSSGQSVRGRSPHSVFGVLCGAGRVARLKDAMSFAKWRLKLPRQVFLRSHAIRERSALSDRCLCAASSFGFAGIVSVSTLHQLLKDQGERPGIAAA